LKFFVSENPEFIINTDHILGVAPGFGLASGKVVVQMLDGEKFHITKPQYEKLKSAILRGDFD